MGGNDIASILHRDTLAVIVGNRIFERGEQCFAGKRVLETVAAHGELRGVVRAQDHGRANYAVRIWVREDGIAYQCTCPIGANQEFCKHAVAVALAHLSQQQRQRQHDADARAALCARLTALGMNVLVERLVERAGREPELLAALHRLVDDRAI